MLTGSGEGCKVVKCTSGAVSEQSPEYGSCLAFLEPGEGLAWPVGESLGGEGMGECEGREGGMTRQRRDTADMERALLPSYYNTS